MGEEWFDGEWQYDPAFRGFVYYEAGEYEVGVSMEPKYVLSRKVVRQLVPLMEEHQIIVPRLDERLRVEDLKITHRLLDILERRTD